ncbi:MAG: excinuclease ABC subunit UvrC [Gammaproteobacteria bacterium]|nr:excinuclease ABC subunit UvrC [Gammaproteobacteria bacterium]
MTSHNTQKPLNVSVLTEAQVFDVDDFVTSLTQKPGVYRMLDSQGQVIYVGKARNLKKRVASYFQKRDKSPKTRLMVGQIANILVTVTHTEGEALLLESNLIKELKPRYNILLRDDKSYPYIYLDKRHGFPRLSFHRGAKNMPGEYFGPYPSAGAVRETLNLLQKVFRIRQCDDNFFRNRTRACLQYQIQRCTAPCVSQVDEARYEEDLRHAIMFLQGKSVRIIEELVAEMEVAAKALAYEKAARYRDQIASLRRVQEKQYISSEHGNIDVIAAVEKNGVGCVQVFFIRDGRNLGNKTFFPKHTQYAHLADILDAFISQYYLSRNSVSQKTADTIPAEIITNAEPGEIGLLQDVLSSQAERKININYRVRGDRARWVKMAELNAVNALTNQLANKASLLNRFEALQDALVLDTLPQRLECFDISHTMGEATVASCVVMDTNGLVKADYRRFNIDGITPGDDYAAMQQALTRRYTRLKKGEGKLPDILFIDGGKGQLSEAEKVLEELQISGVLLVGVAKGLARKPGLETLFIINKNHALALPSDSSALHLVQQIRDEAHRFAITGHRQRRAKARTRSILEDITGLGPKRRQRLLKQFGGLQGIQRAGIEDLSKVSGISVEIAQKIYDTFHSDD